MNTRQHRVEHLTLRTIDAARPEGSHGQTVLILGNAYGTMPYQLPLATALAERGFDPWWFAFSGQEGTKGIFQTDSVLQDVSVALNYLCRTRPNRPLSIASHCMGALVALEYLKQNSEMQAHVKNMIIYGLLFDPARRWKHALPRLKKSGVNVGFTKEDANYSPLAALSSVNIPILFCHAKDKLNLRRATEQEIAIAVGIAPHARLAWFDKGYDRDIETLPEFVECYCAWLLESCQNVS